MTNKSIMIDGTEYMPKSSQKQKAESLEGMKYVIVRTYSAGVFAGYLAKRKGKEVTLKQARRLWQWAGAASLSQLAMEGTSAPDSCKFPCEVDSVDLTEAIEIIDCTEESRLSIKDVKIWKV
jgi:hypothetical protein